MSSKFRYGSATLVATDVLDTYFHFACERQAAFVRRVCGDSPPWTADAIVANYRFTNAYRASDRVSQHLIRDVQYAGDQSSEGLFFRTILFKFFNKIETWERLTAALGELYWYDGFVDDAVAVLDEMMRIGASVYTAAYMMPQPAFGAPRKHTNHLMLLDAMMRDGMPSQVSAASSLEEVYLLLRSYPSIGDFLAFQYAIDLNYSTITNFSEMDFVVAGPGALSGIRKCFHDTDGLAPSEVIRAVADTFEWHLDRLGLQFLTLWGRRPQLIDCQNLFCETDKYARVAHPSVLGLSGRTKIKQRYHVAANPLKPQWYPPKWGLNPYGLGDHGVADRRHQVCQQTRSMTSTHPSGTPRRTERI